MLLHIIKKEKDLDEDGRETSTIDETISRIRYNFSFLFENESEIHYSYDENVQNFEGRK